MKWYSISKESNKFAKQLDLPTKEINIKEQTIVEENIKKEAKTQGKINQKTLENISDVRTEN